jgi:hypothetical protein
MKVVYNGCYGVFGLSEKAQIRYWELRGEPRNTNYWANREIPRHDPALVQVVEELSDGANGNHAVLVIAEIPDGSWYFIDEYDGCESVETPETIEWVKP